MKLSPSQTIRQRHSAFPSFHLFASLAGAILTGFFLTSCGGGRTPPPPSPNPVPTLASISPSNAVAGGTGFTLTATGTRFVSSSVIRWNASNRSTAFRSSTQLTATISAADIASVGTAQVTVFNPSPGGGTSAALTFTVNASAPLTFTTTRLPDTTGGKTYSYTLGGGGGVPPLNWSIASGALPGSLTLESSTGTIAGVVDLVGSDTTANFTVQVMDSAASPNSVTQPLSILVRAAGLGQNDTCTPGSTAGTTAISNGRIRASISPYGDLDVYSFQGTAGAQVTIEIFAQRLDLDGDPVTRDSHLDAITELLDNSCNRLTFSDDIDPGVMQDSLIQNYILSYSGTYFIRVRDFRGDGRPDLIYELSLSGAN